MTSTLRLARYADAGESDAASDKSEPRRHKHSAHHSHLGDVLLVSLLDLDSYLPGALSSQDPDSFPSDSVTFRFWPIPVALRSWVVLK
jgi:hypothetical protein